MFKLKMLYLFFYFATGATLTYFSRYFNILGIDGKIIGIIFALGTLIAMVFQPCLGILADKSKRSDRIIITLFLLLILGLGLIYYYDVIMLDPVTVIALGYIIYSIAMWGIMPLLDGITLGAHYPFGSVRLYGSIGFAMGSLATGKLTAYMGEQGFLIIGGLFSLIGIICVIFQDKIKLEEHEKAEFSDVLLLFKNRRYRNFIIFSLFLVGANTVYNGFLSLYFAKIGGSLEMLGIVIMMMTLIEVPFMWYSDKLIGKLGTRKMLIASGMFFVLRWISYYLFPYPEFLRNAFIMQGLSGGMFFSVASTHIKSIVSKKVLATASTIQMAAGTLGGTILQALGGGVISRYGVVSLFLFIGVITLGATLLFMYSDRNNQEVKC